MWIAKIKVDASNALVGRYAKKHKISFNAHPLASYELDGKIYRYYVGMAFGNEKDISSFVRDFKKDKRVVNLERNSNFIIAQFFDPVIFKGIHHHKIINLEPIIVDSEGGELWTIASWRKRELCDFISAFEKGHKLEVIWIGQKKIKDLSIVRFQPSLTLKQRNAFELATKEGYYNYPRKISIQNLAKNSDLSFSTFHAHLRKAEQKLLPFLFQKSDNYR